MYSDTYNTNGNLGSILLLKICAATREPGVTAVSAHYPTKHPSGTIGHSHTRQRYIKRLINR
jgi:hypothetical protein